MRLSNADSLILSTLSEDGKFAIGLMCAITILATERITNYGKAEITEQDVAKKIKELTY